MKKHLWLKKLVKISKERNLKLPKQLNNQLKRKKIKSSNKRMRNKYINQMLNIPFNNTKIKQQKAKNKMILNLPKISKSNRKDLI